MRRSIILLCVGAYCLFSCVGCSSQTETKTSSDGHAHPPAGSAAAKFLERSSGGRNAPRPPGGFSR